MGLTTRGVLAGALALSLVSGMPRGLSAQVDGVLRGAHLRASVDDGGAARVRAEFTLSLVPGSGGLPLRLLHDGPPPRELTARVYGGGPGSSPAVHTVTLQLVREGLREGRVPSPSEVSGAVRVVLDYSLEEVLVRRESAAEALLHLPWVVVPWAPEDGSPGRVTLELEFPSTVELSGAFPASLRPSPGGSGAEGAALWATSLPVLPSVTRGRVSLEAEEAWALQARPQDADLPGTPPAMALPGFVFSGLFGAFALVVLGYALWLRGQGGAGTS